MRALVPSDDVLMLALRPHMNPAKQVVSPGSEFYTSRPRARELRINGIADYARAADDTLGESVDAIPVLADEEPDEDDKPETPEVKAVVPPENKMLPPAANKAGGPANSKVK